MTLFQRYLLLLLVVLGILESCSKQKPVSEQQPAPFSPQDTMYRGIATTHIKLADSLKLKLDYNRSFNEYLKALNQYTIHKDVDGEFLVYVRLAEYYRARRLFKKSANQLKKASKLLSTKKIQEQHLIPYYNRKAALYSEYFFIPDSVIFYSEKALYLAEKHKDTNNIFLSVTEIGLAHENIDPKESIPFYYAALKLVSSDKYLMQYCNALGNYCRALARSEKTNEALETALKGYQLTLQNYYIFDRMHFAHYLAYLYLKKKNYKLAYKYMQIEKNLVFFYYRKMYDNQIAEIEKTYQLSENKHQLTRKQLELNKTEAKLKNEQLIRNAVLIILIIVLLSSLIALYSYRRVQKQNKTLQFLFEQNEFLISETNHRVNNNLQLISIFINEEKKKSNVESKGSFIKLTSRVESIAVLHRQLYKGQNKKKVNFPEYIEEIIQNNHSFIDNKNIDVRLTVEIDELSVEKAMYLGLLISELFMNSVKHGFNKILDDLKPVISIQVLKIKDKISIIYQDNGSGSETTSKPIIIDKICRQLKATYSINSENGYYFYTEIIR